MPSPHTVRKAPWLLLPVLLAAAASPQPVAPPQQVFMLRIASPDPLYLAGPCRVAAVAEAPDGTPYDRIAWMTLSVDGSPPRADGEPPFAWELDFGDESRPRRLTVEAVDRDGAKVTLSVLSTAHPYQERVGVNLVLVPTIVREAAKDGAIGPLVTGLSAQDFEVYEDGVRQPLATFSSEAVSLSLAVALDNSASMERSLWSAQRAVIEFVRAQPERAAVSLLSFNDQVYLERDFTGDRQAVISAVNKVRPEGTRTALIDALRIGSGHLARRAGSRVLVLFTDGQDTVYEGDVGRLRTAIEAAQRADVSVFAVAFGAADLTSLREMAQRTGGELVRARGTRDLKTAFSRLADSLGSRYVLGFEPTSPDRPGYRKLVVKVNRPGVRVVAREGYHAGNPSSVQ
ncbi:MAG: VWA domain-containing protein [Candidatus Polarisedimenticolia bacterium]